ERERGDDHQKPRGPRRHGGRPVEPGRKAQEIGKPQERQRPERRRRAPQVQCWLFGSRTTSPSSSSVTLIWQERRELSSTSLAKSSIDCSIELCSPVLASQSGST